MIEQGIDGISMTSFADLPAADRWALAFYIRTLAYSADKAVDSKAQWEADALPRTEFDLQKLVRLRAAVRASQLGEPKPPSATSSFLASFTTHRTMYMMAIVAQFTTLRV